MELSEIIIQRIRENGPICFRDFMEMCLYHPEHGYYTASIRNPIGKEGDFYTSTCFASIFGTLIGRQLEEIWETMDDAPFTIIEYGAGTGSLCHDILAYLRNNKRMYDHLEYCIIEKSPAMRSIQKKHLNEKVYWHDSIEELSGINGCILSNEVVDNFAVHQVVMGKELMEVFVDHRDGFVEVLQPARKELKDYLAELGVDLPQGFRTEINLNAVDWIKEIATALDHGYVITTDYGYQSSELYKASRNQGTILCYHKHTVNDAVYNKIGKQDITSHVNFSALSYWGAKNGLNECGYTNQCEFLLALGYKDYINQVMSQEKDIVSAARKASILNHTLLMDMGNKFKVLIQGKGVCKKGPFRP